MKALGIDIGGTSLKVVYFDNSKIKSFFLKTPANKKDFLALIKNLILENGGGNLDRIGFGVPGQVDHLKLVARHVPNIPYLNGLDFGKFVRGLGLGRRPQVRLDNDVNCHLTAEIRFGAGRDLKNAVMIAIGSGIGGAILLNSEIYHGQGSAGEIGWTILDRELSFEQLAGGKTLRRFNTAEVKRVCHYAGIACANTINLLNPDAIILTGGVVHSNPIIKGARKVMQKYIIDPKARKTPLLHAQMGEFGAAFGAAWL